ncbi:MAG: hypothetical protein KIT84_30475 [Labilithrix sp.]|nr:hypothetical protein [Labilithrix sp.]MCW5815392.1 hypothetical protein [Labilithrix sp.]
MLGSTVALGARAKGRTPLGGRVSLRAPWPVGPIDPHRLDDPIAALFGEALFDTLFVGDDSGGYAPALADGEPDIEGSTIKVKVRLGLKTAREKPFGTKDAAFAIARARASGARGWLGDVPVPREDGRALYFVVKDPAKDLPRLKAALASPLVAMTPLGFSPETPDGTGPFRWGIRDGALALTRNRFAARGPAFLDEVVVRSAASVSASLLAFEGGTDDIGWFERGLHEPRAGSKAFDFGAVGWAMLFTGRDANNWDGPGIAQRIADGIPYARLSSLHVGAAWTPDPAQGWGGPPTTLLVREDAPWLIEVANVVAATISRPSHEVTVKAVPATEMAARRASRLFGLALDVVRHPGGGSLGAAVAMATANDPSRAADVVAHPPKLAPDVPARTLTRTYRCGVVGEIKLSGGRMPDLVLVPSPTGFGVDLGASYRARAR